MQIINLATCLNCTTRIPSFELTDVATYIKLGI